MKKKIIKILLFIVFTIYAVVTLINQQITLNRYSENQASLTQDIDEANEYNAELATTMDNVNSEDFIEQMAREKLDMYLPTERVYVDTGM